MIMMPNRSLGLCHAYPIFINCSSRALYDATHSLPVATVDLAMSPLKRLYSVTARLPFSHTDDREVDPGHKSANQTIHRPWIINKLTAAPF